MNGEFKIQLGPIELNYVLALTDAPKNYDGFGTFTIAEYGWPVEGYTRKDARLVAIRAEHLHWQTGRYSSGLNTCWTGSEGLEAVAAEEKDIAETLYKKLLA